MTTPNEIFEQAIEKIQVVASELGLSGFGAWSDSLSSTSHLLQQLKSDVCPECRGLTFTDITKGPLYCTACDGKGDYRSWAENEIKRLKDQLRASEEYRKNAIQDYKNLAERIEP
jgi:hypothetical protein